MDATEGDPDAEADEPTMAAIRAAAERYRDEQEDDEDGADDEPSLGMSEPILTGAERDYWFPYYSDDAAQARPLATACTDDREDDGDDLEPSLCGVTAGAVPLIGGAVEDGEINDDDHDTDLGWTRTGAWGNTLDLEEALS